MIILFNKPNKDFFKNIFSLLYLFKFLLLFLCLRFFSESTLLFYFFFEASLIPIFWIILGWGYQPERTLARIIIFFYTLASSFPLLISLFLINYLRISTSLLTPFIFYPETNSLWFSLTLVTAFLVKFPIFMFHLWLPKAHVEAPVAGSIILAGVLLKLGGYGLYRLAALWFIGPANYFIIISILGGAYLRILCCRLTDIKVIIAYSSVVHMSMIIAALLRLEKTRLLGIWWIILAHGLVSSGIFAGANILYEQRHSRRILINKGGLRFNPAFSLFWFLLLIINFRGPFTLNLLRETNLIMGVLSISFFYLSP